MRQSNYHNQSCRNSTIRTARIIRGNTINWSNHITVKQAEESGKAQTAPHPDRGLTQAPVADAFMKDPTFEKTSKY